MQPYLADLRINGRATSSKKCLGALLDDAAGLQDFPRQPGDWDLRDAIHCDPFAFRGGGGVSFRHIAFYKNKGGGGGKGIAERGPKRRSRPRARGRTRRREGAHATRERDAV